MIFDNIKSKISNLDVRSKSSLEILKESVELKKEGNKDAAKLFVKFFDKLEEERSNGKEKENYEKLQTMEEEIRAAFQRLNPSSPTYDSNKAALNTRLQMVMKTKQTYDLKNQIYDTYKANGVDNMSLEEIYDKIPSGNKTK